MVSELRELRSGLGSNPKTCPAAKCSTPETLSLQPPGPVQVPAAVVQPLYGTLTALTVKAKPDRAAQGSFVSSCLNQHQVWVQSAGSSRFCFLRLLFKNLH